jgi:TonB family protein
MSVSAESPASSSRCLPSSCDASERSRFSGAFLLSALLHGGSVALFVMAAWALREKARQEEPFVLLASPARQAGVAPGPGSFAGDPDADSVSGALDFRQEMVRRQRAEELRAEREVARMREQRRQEEARSRAEAERAAAVDREANADRANATARRETSRTTSYSEFKRMHGVPTPRDTSQRSFAEQRPGLRVNASEVSQVSPGPMAGGAPGSGSDAEARAMNRYFDDLVARLREAHEDSAGLSDLLSADVEFTLAADGAISAARILRSSGDANFDRSILDACSRVRMSARPDGKSDTRRLTFRVRAS